MLSTASRLPSCIARYISVIFAHWSPSSSNVTTDGVAKSDFTFSQFFVFQAASKESRASPWEEANSSMSDHWLISLCDSSQLCSQICSSSSDGRRLSSSPALSNKAPYASTDSFTKPYISSDNANFVCALEIADDIEVQTSRSPNAS